MAKPPDPPQPPPESFSEFVNIFNPPPGTDQPTTFPAHGDCAPPDATIELELSDGSTLGSSATTMAMGGTWSHSFTDVVPKSNASLTVTVSGTSESKTVVFNIV